MNLRTLRAYFDYFVGNAEYLFIHIPKNAGVSMRKSDLLQGKMVGAEPRFHRSREYTQRLTEVMKAAGEHHGYHHARLIDIDPRVRARLQPVAVIRNPWSRVVSRYRFAQSVVEQGGVSAAYVGDSFEAFLEERHTFGNREFYWHRAVRGWYPQVDYVVNEQGALAADLLRQEDLGSEAMRYFGLPEQPRRRNVSTGERKPYQAFYDAKTIQIVADWYAKDIETFGFDFDSAATRNVYFAESRSAAA